MNTINPYSNVDHTHPSNRAGNQNKVEKPEAPSMSRAEIISSKDLSPEEKMDKLGIKPWTANELSENLAQAIIDGEV